MTDHDQDIELVERMLDGDEEAYDFFGERYFPALYRFTLVRLDGDRELTRDTVQTAMTKALTNLASYRGEASLLTWLCACCRNEILMLLRSRKAAPEQVELADTAAPSPAYCPVLGGNPEGGLLRRERAHQVHMTLDLLAPQHSRALRFKYIDRLSVKQIAARLEVSPKAAESLLTRARVAFKERFAAVQSAAVEPSPDAGRTVGRRAAAGEIR